MEYLTVATLTIGVLTTILMLGHLYWHRSIMRVSRRRY